MYCVEIQSHCGVIIHVHSSHTYTFSVWSHVEIINGSKRCARLDEYAPFSTNIWSWVDIVIFSCLPWLCLAVSNSLLVWKLNVSVREAEVSLGAGQTDRIKDRTQKAATVTVTLVAVSTAFLVLTLPMSVIYILNNTFAVAGSSGAGRLRVYHYVSETSYVLWYLNSCINFYLYCLTGSKYRREGKQILSCIFDEGKEKAERNTTVSTLSSDSETQFG